MCGMRASAIASDGYVGEIIHSRYLIDHGTVLSRQLTRPPLCDASEKPTLCNLQPNGGSTALVLFFVLWTYLKWKSKSPIARRLPRAACQLGSSIEAQAAAERTCSRAAQRNSISTADASSRAEVATADGQHQNSSIGVRVASRRRRDDHRARLRCAIAVQARSARGEGGPAQPVAAPLLSHVSHSRDRRALEPSLPLSDP